MAHVRINRNNRHLLEWASVDPFGTPLQRSFVQNYNCGNITVQEKCAAVQVDAAPLLLGSRQSEQQQEDVSM